MLLIICPNLCLDRLVVVRGFRAGAVHRADRAIEVAGGKGMNVARAALRLGAAVRVIGLVGGRTGETIVHGAQAEGIALDAVEVPDESRTCTLVVDPGQGETVINEPGPTVNGRCLDAFWLAITDRLPEAGVLVLSGSLPPGLPSDFYARVVKRAAGTPAIADTSGEALRASINARPFVAKVNRQELGEIAGCELPSLETVRAAADRIQRMGVAHVVVTLGAEGVLLVTEDGEWLVPAPQVSRTNGVGAGDSLAAGLALAMLRGWPMPDAVRLGMGAAASDLETLLPGEIDSTRVQALFSSVACRPLARGADTNRNGGYTG